MEPTTTVILQETPKSYIPIKAKRTVLRKNLLSELHFGNNRNSKSNGNNSNKDDDTLELMEQGDDEEEEGEENEQLASNANIFGMNSTTNPGNDTAVMKQLLKEIHGFKNAQMNKWDMHNITGTIHPLQTMLHNQLVSYMTPNKAKKQNHSVASQTLHLESLGSYDTHRCESQHDITRTDIPTITREYEESYMRPPQTHEEQCKHKKACQGNVIARVSNDVDDLDGFTLVQFKTSQYPQLNASFQNMCVLCVRYKVTHDWLLAYLSENPLSTVIQPYRNLVGVENEYAIESVIPTTKTEFYGIIPNWVHFKTSMFEYYVYEENGVKKEVRIRHRPEIRFRYAPTVRTKLFPVVETKISCHVPLITNWSVWLGQYCTHLEDLFESLDNPNPDGPNWVVRENKRLNNTTPLTLISCDSLEVTHDKWVLLISCTSPTTPELLDVPHIMEIRKRIVSEYILLDNRRKIIPWDMSSELKIWYASTIVLLTELLNNVPSSSVLHKRIIEARLERNLAQYKLLLQNLNHLDELLIQKLRFGLDKMCDLTHVLHFSGIAGRDYFKETHKLPVVELIMYALPQSNRITQFKGKCLSLVQTHAYLHKWIGMLIHASFGGFYPHCVSKPDILKRLHMMEFYFTTPRFVDHLIQTTPFVVIFMINEYIMFLIQREPILRKAYCEYHKDWISFEELVLDGMYETRVMWYENKGLAEMNTMLELKLKSKSRKTLFRRETGPFWEYIVSQFNTFEKIKRTHTQQQQDIWNRGITPTSFKYLKTIDARVLYDSTFAPHKEQHIDGLLRELRSQGYSETTLELLNDLFHSHATNESDKTIRTKIDEYTLTIQLDVFYICLFVYESFKIRVVRMPWHWYLNHKRADTSIVAETNEERLDRRNTYVCPQCHSLKSHLIQNEMELPIKKNTKSTKTKSKRKQRKDDEVYCVASKDISYDPLDDKVYCFKPDKSGRRKELDLMDELYVDYTNGMDQTTLKQKLYTRTHKKKSQNSEVTLFRYSGCNNTEIIPIEMRGNILVKYNHVVSKCFKCGGLCTLNILRGIQNEFICSMCDPSVFEAETKCESCNNVMSSNNKMIWHPVTVVNKPGALHTHVIWFCAKCAKIPFSKKTWWDYGKLIHKLGEATQKTVGKKYKQIQV
ncbi:MAG: hypothetical protein ACTSUE_13745 [Promethearchaeota archaeon]